MECKLNSYAVHSSWRSQPRDLLTSKINLIVKLTSHNISSTVHQSHNASVRLIPPTVLSDMRIKPFIRRLLSLRITSVWISLYHLLPYTSTPTQQRKHIKIDDEEKNQDSDAESHTPNTRLTARTQRNHALKMLLLILLILIPLLLILAYTIYNPPLFLISALQRHSPSVLYHIAFPSPPPNPRDSANRIIALTIDDAPSIYTAHILELLRRYNAHATFFIIGSQIAYSTSYPALLEKIVEAGHELGNHAWSDEPSISLPLPELSAQITHVESLLPPNTNGAKYFRPGSGFFNSKMVKMVEGLGYKMVLGSIYAHDPQVHNPVVNARAILSRVREGGVVIMHDRRDYSLEQLEIVLRGLQEGGWRVESVGGLLAHAEAAKTGVDRGKRPD